MDLKKKLRLKVKLTENKELKPGFRRIRFIAPQLSRACAPGQFLNIMITDGYEPLLRRPFSIHSVRGGSLEVLYQVVGEGTRLLAEKRPGECLDVIGPLGNGFDLQRYAILVAGGMGVAPLLFLAERLKQRRPLVLIGAKTKDQILCEKEFKRLGCSVKVATDDGSRGFKGKATGLLESFLRFAIRDKRYAIYACGPKPMLREVCRIAGRSNIPAQISLEEHMSCGIGACMGCVVKTKGGYKRVCKEGPVFGADEIIWGAK